MQAGNLRKKIPLVFVPELRPMIAAGIVEGSISLNQIDFSKMEPVRSGDVFERELRAQPLVQRRQGSAGGRAAFFLKGKIRGDYLLTAAYDSERPPATACSAISSPTSTTPSTATRRSAASTRKAPAAWYVRIDKRQVVPAVWRLHHRLVRHGAPDLAILALAQWRQAITRRTSRVARWK